MHYPRLFVSHENYANGFDEFTMIPDIDAERDRWEILSWDLEPGDGIVFRMRSIRGVSATTGLKSRWLGDDARFAARPWKSSPPFEEVDLIVGDKMDHPSFPVVWSSKQGQYC